MEKYTYLTLSVPYGLGKKKIARRIQKVLDAKAKEGWRLIKFDLSDLLGTCVLIFEKEIIKESQQEYIVKKPEQPKQEVVHDEIKIQVTSEVDDSEDIKEAEDIVE